MYAEQVNVYACLRRYQQRAFFDMTQAAFILPKSFLS